jgi:RNA polymerase sigma factor (sigma-70 family)
MRIEPVETGLLERARNGDLRALDAVLHAIQPGVYNLAVRMLGNREDARDATQEILLKVTTHLGSFRGEAAFSTWVYRVAKNQLLTCVTRTRESPEVSFEALGETLKAGLELGRPSWEGRSLSPEDKAAARETAVTCTQAMLMRLDRAHRMAYLLDAVFGLSSDDAAQVLEMQAPAYRKRLSRARSALETFSDTACGLANPDAACRCERQVHAVQVLKARGVERAPDLKLAQAERAAASAALDQVLAMSDIAAVIRAHPAYQAPSAMITAIRAVVTLHDAPSADKSS